jgi:hypothetical protein
MENMLQRRRLPRITSDSEFAHREAQWIADEITDYEYLTACYQLYQIQRAPERVMLSERGSNLRD